MLCSAKSFKLGGTTDRMNTPNKLTVLRMILAPVFLAVLLAERLPYHFWWAVLVFSVAAITDAIDGRLARKNGQITVFG